MRPRTRIAIVGVGKIARDQHLPALAKSADFDLVATASRSNSVGRYLLFQICLRCWLRCVDWML